MLRGHIYTYTGWGRGRGMPLKSEVIQATNQPAPLSRIDAPSLKREGRRNWHQAAAFLYTAAQTRSDFIHCTVSHSLWAAAGHTGSGEQGKTRHGQLSPLWSSPQRSSSFGLYSPRTLKAQPRVLAAVQNIRREKASVCVCGLGRVRFKANLRESKGQVQCASALSAGIVPLAPEELCGALVTRTLRLNVNKERKNRVQFLPKSAFFSYRVWLCHPGSPPLWGDGCGSRGARSDSEAPTPSPHFLLIWCSVKIKGRWELHFVTSCCGRRTCCWSALR